MLVFVADSDAAHRLSLTQAITAAGHVVSECINAHNLISMARKKFPDLLFLSHNLSGVEGITLLKQLRALGGHAVWNPIILIGADMSVETMRAAIQVGADDCFNKPLSAIQIEAKLASAVRMMELKEEVFAVAHELVLSNRAMEGLVTQDVLTGLGNSNGFEEKLEKEWFKARKEQTSLAVIMLDVDYLGQYNDTYGAEAGDTVLRQIAEVLQEHSGKLLFMAHTGGGTFVLIVAAERAQAMNLAVSLCAEVTALQIPHTASGCGDYITVSGGVSTTGTYFTSPWDLVEAADYGLYQAKHQGRNKVCYEEIEHNS